MIEPFTPHHLMLFDGDVDYLNLHAMWASPVYEMFTIVHKGSVLFIAGIQKIRAGVAEVWILRSKRMENNKLAVFKYTLKLLGTAKRYGGFRKLQMTVKDTEPQWHKWALKLGFEYEGKIKEYDEGIDHTLYGKVL